MEINREITGNFLFVATFIFPTSPSDAIYEYTNNHNNKTDLKFSNNCYVCVCECVKAGMWVRMFTINGFLL